MGRRASTSLNPSNRPPCSPLLFGERIDDLRGVSRVWLVHQRRRDRAQTWSRASSTTSGRLLTAPESCLNLLRCDSGGKYMENRQLIGVGDTNGTNGRDMWWQGEERVICTHHGSFHCDEALACGLLKLLPEFRDLCASQVAPPTSFLLLPPNSLALQPL